MGAHSRCLGQVTGISMNAIFVASSLRQWGLPSLRRDEGGAFASNSAGIDELHSSLLVSSAGLYLYSSLCGLPASWFKLGLY